MSLDPYASCPCGSGKKFKWCCQPIYSGIQRAWELENNEQHEAAAQAMEQVAQAHPDNPEAWGQKALLHSAQGKVEEVEAALEKAFAINPNYPFGLSLRAKIRHAEGEFLGALLLARKAAEAYDPETREALGEAQALIFDCEMRCNRPVAARAALARAVHLLPGEESLRQTLEGAFGPKGRFPEAARKAYEYKKAAKAERRAAWDKALAGASAKLGVAAKAFDELTRQDATDAAAWYNLGLTWAWLGDNAAALPALDRYVELEPNEAAAAEAAALAEVLRFGHGMEEQCDYLEYSFVLQLTAPEPVQKLLQEWSEQRRLVPMPTEQEGVFVAMVLELTATGLVTVGRPAAEVGRVAGYLFIVGNLLRFASPVKERFDRVRDEVRKKLALGLTELKERRGLAPYSDVLTEALTVGLASKSEEEEVQSVIENARRFFEDTWIHRPLKSLSNIAPVDAAGSAKLRKKLLGLIQFLEQCASPGVLSRYSFDGLRRKLGLLGGSAPTASTSQQADVSAMGAAELAALKPESLSEDQLEKAYQAAYRLDAQELAESFAQALVGRPASPAKPDRYPWYSFLIQKAVRDGAQDAALDLVNAGERHDCEHNGGKRRDEFELFRAQVHAKRGEAQEAQDVYQRLVDRKPRDFKVRGRAAEAMMSLKQPAKALKFAEDGVAAARQANDRDSEQYLMELAAAAKRQVG
ncbi:MAG: tetratricopeptide repeat protein [Gemmataceae bacterium]